MAGELSLYAEAKLLDHLSGKTAFTKPTAYVALCTATVTDSMTGATITEVANSNGYTRVTTAGADWNAATGTPVVLSNLNALTFPADVTGAWGHVTDFAVLDSATWGAGNILWFGTLTVAKDVGVGDTPSFAGGQLTVTAD